MGSAFNSGLETSDAPFFLVLFLTSGAVSLTSDFLERDSGTGTAFLTGLAGVDCLGSGFLPLGLTVGFATGLEFLAGALPVGALLAGPLFAGALAGGTGRDCFFGKDFTGLVGAFFEGAGAGFVLAGAFFGSVFFAGALG